MTAESACHPEIFFDASDSSHCRQCLLFIDFNLIALFYGGVLLVIGRGNEEYIDKAKTSLFTSMMGLAFAVLGYAFIYGIATIGDLTQNPETTSDDLNVDTFPNAPIKSLLTLAAIQLDPTMKPENLPSLVTPLGPSDPNNPESAFTQTFNFFCGRPYHRTCLYSCRNRHHHFSNYCRFLTTSLFWER